MSTIYLPSITGVSMRRVVVPRKNAQERDRLVTDGKCVKCGEPIEEGERVTRGCHHSCYQTTRNWVLSGKTTYDKEMRAGRLLPPGTAGRKPRRRAREVLAG